MPTVRAESVPLHTSSYNNNNPSYTSRAQSEHPSSYQTQSTFTNYAPHPSHSHQQPQQQPQSTYYRQYPTTYPLPTNRHQFHPNNAFQANSTNNSRCTTQFPLPPPRESRREESQQHNHFHQQQPIQQHIACPATPIAYINNNPNSPLPNATVIGQGQSVHPSHSHPMFAYHNNNNHNHIANLISSNGGGAPSTVVSNNQLNHNSNHHAITSANINTLPPLSNLASIPPAPTASPPLNNHHNNSPANNCNALNNVSQGNNHNGNVYSSQQTTLNNQVPPGNRANNYWDNFRR